MTWVKTLKKRFSRDNGNVTIEFVMFFPLFMTLFLTSFELGIYSLRTVLLERAMDINIRTLRLGALSPATVDEFKRRMCSQMIYFPTCMTDLAVDVRALDSSWTLPTGKIPCRDRVDGVDPSNILFAPGSDSVPTLLRACLVMDPFFGSTEFVMGMPTDPSGGAVMTALSTYVAEPR